MYAIVRIGGRQYRAEVGGTIVVEKLPHDVGDRVEFDEVLLISDGKKTKIGKPLVKGAKVKTTIKEQFKGRKIVVFKYKPRTSTRYRRKQGHRQCYTRLMVNDIVSSSRAKRQPDQPDESETAE